VSAPSEHPADGRTVAALGRARLLALDVDGTLTDGRIHYLGGEELQSFHVRDGQGLVWLRRAGLRVAWISGRGCKATEERARELGVDRLCLRVADKRAALEAVQAEFGIAPEETVAMGDDLPDLAFVERAACLAVPADACVELRAAAGLVTRARGGEGAVRELCELLLQAQGHWSRIAEGGAR
jgi:3-deoxy-D-manno-octulosonate 8-phosphate phosphatase (KDO 8-P phosphatase)